MSKISWIYCYAIIASVNKDASFKVIYLFIYLMWTILKVFIELVTMLLLFFTLKKFFLAVRFMGSQLDN